MSWEVSSDAAWEAKYRSALGDAEFERRLDAANCLHEQMYEDESQWQEAMVVGSQIKSVMMQLRPEQFEVAKDWPIAKWTKFIYRLAGV